MEHVDGYAWSRPYTNRKNKKRTSMAQVCEWVKQTQDNIWPEIVVKSFKKCDICNVLYRTEDDALFNDYDSWIENECLSFDNEDDEFYGFEDG